MAVLRSRSLAAFAAVALGALAAGACSEDKTGDAAEFCTELQANAEAIMNPQLTTNADVEAHLGLYQSLADTVPLAIEEEWGTLVDAYETASSVVPGDVESAEVARRAIYASESSGLAVRDWVESNCAFDLATVGPIGTVATPTTVTTVPPEG